MLLYCHSPLYTLSTECGASGEIAESSGVSSLTFTEMLEIALQISYPLAVPVAPYPYNIQYCPAFPFVPIGWYLITV